jgi:hypothetical protein
MNSSNFSFMAIVFALVILLMSAAAAEEINQGELPVPYVVCEGVAMEYSDMDTCLPGDIIRVPVLVTSPYALTYLQIWGTLPAGLTYDSLDIGESPWEGEISDFSTSSTIEIHLERGGYLPELESKKEVIAVYLEISDTVFFDTSLTIKFGHNIAAQIEEEPYDCDVTDTTWGTVPIGSDPCINVALEYADVDSCWPGDTVSVPVLVTNADTLGYLEIWAVCPAGISYDTLDATGTPWSGSIADSSSGSTVEIYLERGGTLPPDTSERVIDLKFIIPDTTSYGTSFTIKFGHDIAASKKGTYLNCDVSDTTWGTITVLEYECSGVALEYEDVDGWMGDTVNVPVLVTNADTLKYLEIWALCPSGVSYDTFDAHGSRWSGSIADSSSGDTVEIYLELGGTLPPDTSEKVIDLKFSGTKSRREKQEFLWIAMLSTQPAARLQFPRIQ